MHRSSRALAFSLAFALFAGVAAPRTSLAVTDAETAQALYDQGLALRDAGDVPGSVKVFELAFAKVPSPIIGLDLARGYEKLGRLLDALKIVETIAAMPRLPEETERSTAARSEASRLGVTLPPRIATLVLVLTGAGSAGSTLVIDGALVPDSAKNQPRKMDPGKHTIVVASSKEVVTELLLAPGETRSLTLTVEGAPMAGPAPAPAPATTSASARSLGPLGYVGFGLAGAGLVVGTVTGLLAINKSSQLRDGCRSDGNCPPGEADTLHQARVLGNYSTGAFAVAIGGAVLGVYDLLTHKTEPAKTTTTGGVQPWVGVGSIGVVGAF
jgi:hypothetical protein